MKQQLPFLPLSIRFSWYMTFPQTEKKKIKINSTNRRPLVPAELQCIFYTHADMHFGKAITIIVSVRILDRSVSHNLQ